MRGGSRATAAVARRVVKRELRKQAQWISVFNTGCQPVNMQPGGTCPNGGVIQLVSPTQLESHDDSMRILRILCRLRVGLAVPNNGRDIPAQWGWLVGQGIQVRMGLKRSEFEGDPATASGLAFNPLDGRPSPLHPNENDGDFADAGWMHLWEHTWMATPSINVAPVDGCCSVVSGDITGGASAIDNGLTWAVSDGAINTEVVGTIGTECTACGEDQYLGSSSVQYPHSWEWNFDRKKAIEVKDNHMLGLYIGWSLLPLLGPATFDPNDQPILVLLGSIKMLVETA